MSLEKLLGAGKYALAGALLAAAKPAVAEDPVWLSSSAPESVCAQRYETLFKSGSEPSDLVVPVGVQDCSTLESTIDPNRSAGSSITVPLEGGFSYDHAVVKTLPGESARSFSAVGVPAWASFDSEYGVFSGSPSCEGAGSYAVEFNVDYSDMPLVVNYEVSCPSSFNVLGLDYENNGLVSGTPHHGTWDDSDNDGTIDQPVKVREGRSSFNPWEAYVLSPDKSVTLTPQNSQPEYISVSGNKIEFGRGGLEGDSGTLEYLVCD